MRKFLRTLLYMLLKFKIYTFLKGKFAEYLQNFLGKTEEEIENRKQKTRLEESSLEGFFFLKTGDFFVYGTLSLQSLFPDRNLSCNGPSFTTRCCFYSELFSCGFVPGFCCKGNSFVCRVSIQAGRFFFCFY